MTGANSYMMLLRNEVLLPSRYRFCFLPLDWVSVSTIVSSRCSYILSGTEQSGMGLLRLLGLSANSSVFSPVPYSNHSSIILM